MRISILNRSIKDITVKVGGFKKNNLNSNATIYEGKTGYILIILKRKTKQI